MFLVMGIFVPFCVGFCFNVYADSILLEKSEIIITEEYITINQGLIRAAGGDF